jgi:integrase
MATISKYKNKSGEFYEYRFVYKDPITGKRKEKSQKGFKKKGDAKAACEAAEKDIKEGFTEDSLTLKAFLDFWLNDHKKTKIRQSTFEKLERNIKGHILPYFKNVKLSDIKPMMYQKFLDHLPEEKNLSYGTSKMNHDLLNEVFKEAVYQQKMKSNPAERATVKGEKSKKKDNEKFIDTDDIISFLQEVKKDDYIYWIFFKTLFDTGLRKGEAAALQWSDIDLKEKTITVSKTLDFKAAGKDDKENMFADPKTYNSIRVISIDPDLADDLLTYKKWQNENKLLYNDAYYHEYNFVFCRKEGKYLPKSSLFNKFRKALEKANLPLALNIHSTRHTHAVACFEAGMKETEIAVRLGHGGDTITKEVYIHVSKKLQVASGEKYAEYKKNKYAIK